MILRQMQYFQNVFVLPEKDGIRKKEKRRSALFWEQLLQFWLIKNIGMAQRLIVGLAILRWSCPVKTRMNGVNQFRTKNRIIYNY